MQQGEANSFRALLQGVYGLYGKDLSTQVIDVWWQAMKPFDLAAVSDAMNRHAVDPDRGQFLPKPADIVRLLRGTTVDSALVAWAKVDRAVRSVGTYQTVVFDDPIVHAVIADMGGWISLGTKNEDEWPFVAKEFENRYRGFRNRGVVAHYPRALTGIVDAENVRAGFPADAPMLIGDQTIAASVFKGGTDAPRLTWKRASESLLTLKAPEPETV